jgi:hypothetical protein
VLYVHAMCVENMSQSTPHTGAVQSLVLLYGLVTDLQFLHKPGICDEKRCKFSISELLSSLLKGLSSSSTAIL